jgi:transglutaminase/protease-like cytokinesis protein 3
MIYLKESLLKWCIVILSVICFIALSIKLIDLFGRKDLRSSVTLFVLKFPGEFPERYFDLVSVKVDPHRNLFSEQVNRLNWVHEQIIELEVSSNVSIDELSEKITGSFSNDLEKLYAIYIWVINNISYDSSVPIYQSADQALRSRRAVCDGISSLVARLSRKAGIPVIQVSGRANNAGSLIPDHAWNAAMIDGNWYLLDPTWDLGNSGFGDLRYFAPDRGEFGKTHYPLDEKWMLTDLNS